MTDDLFNQTINEIYNMLYTIAGAIAGLIYMFALICICSVKFVFHVIWSLIDPFVELGERMVKSEN
jgi:hypothetical protein